MPPKFKHHLNDDDVTGSMKSERKKSFERKGFFPNGLIWTKIWTLLGMGEEIDGMQENITKVIDRGERFDELQNKSESLSENATDLNSFQDRCGGMDVN
uniref:V-SNARE coiled-coil homology domain-containing protein n=1 Tax=Vombatus ursinus TaxID=29139 RepID=A0A4X2LM19_VOMUR